MSRPAPLAQLDPAYARLYDAIVAAATRAGVRDVPLGGSLARGDADRDEWIVGWNAVALLRRMLLDLLLAEGGEAAATGAKRVNPKLTAEQRAVMTELPPLTATRESVIGGHVAVAEAFLPRAQLLIDEWPGELERATRAHLMRALDIELSV